MATGFGFGFAFECSFFTPRGERLAAASKECVAALEGCLLPSIALPPPLHPQPALPHRVILQRDVVAPLLSPRASDHDHVVLVVSAGAAQHSPFRVTCSLGAADITAVCDLEKMMATACPAFPQHAARAAGWINQVQGNQGSLAALVVSGPPGSGKSHLIDTIVRLAKVPVVKVDVMAGTAVGKQAQLRVLRALCNVLTVPFSPVILHLKISKADCALAPLLRAAMDRLVETQAKSEIAPRLALLCEVDGATRGSALHDVPALRFLLESTTAPTLIQLGPVIPLARVGLLRHLLAAYYDKAQCDTSALCAAVQTCADQAHGFLVCDYILLTTNAITRALSSNKQPLRQEQTMSSSLLENCEALAQALHLEMRNTLQQSLATRTPASSSSSFSSSLDFIVRPPPPSSTSVDDKGSLENRLVCVEDLLCRINREFVVPLKSYAFSKKEKTDHCNEILPAVGCLLYGPTGSGKTSVAKHIVGLLGFNCVFVNSSEVISKHVGESEKNIARVCAAARMASPCVLVVENIETLAYKRSSGTNAEGTPFDRLLATLLVELDGITQKDSVVVAVIATTSQREKVDPALLRPGRIEYHVAIENPASEEAKRDFLLGVLSVRPDFKSSLVHAAHIASQRQNAWSRAHLTSIVHAACLSAIRRNAVTLEPQDFLDQHAV